MTREQHLLHQLNRRVSRWMYENSDHEHEFNIDPAILIPEFETFNAASGVITRPAHITKVRISGVTMYACILENCLCCRTGRYEYFPSPMFVISNLSTCMQIKILREIIPQLEKHTYV